MGLKRRNRLVQHFTHRKPFDEVMIEVHVVACRVRIWLSITPFPTLATIHVWRRLYEDYIRRSHPGMSSHLPSWAHSIACFEFPLDGFQGQTTAVEIVDDRGCGVVHYLEW
jgi:hypothetical protein